MKKIYPRRGDIVWVRPRPNATGSEQSGRRPGLVLQNNTGNRHSTTTIVAYLTTKIDFTDTYLPTHVFIKACEGGLRQDSVVMLEQLETISIGRITGKINQRIESSYMKVVERALKTSLGLDGGDLSPEELKDGGKNE